MGFEGFVEWRLRMLALGLCKRIRTEDAYPHDLYFDVKRYILSRVMFSY
jgi:hypothetical protein